MNKHPTAAAICSRNSILYLSKCWESSPKVSGIGTLRDHAAWLRSIFKVQSFREHTLFCVGFRLWGAKPNVANDVPRSGMKRVAGGHPARLASGAGNEERQG